MEDDESFNANELDTKRARSASANHEENESQDEQRDTNVYGIHNFSGHFFAPCVCFLDDFIIMQKGGLKTGIKMVSNKTIFKIGLPILKIVLFETNP